jgi:hypothetical protein
LLPCSKRAFLVRRRDSAGEAYFLIYLPCISLVH